MKLEQYISNNSGRGVLATADGNGNVNTAVYAKPHVFKDGTISFIMRQRLTHQNLLENPHASYLFHENSAGFNGVRLYLKKIGEEKDSELIEKLQRRTLSPEDNEKLGPRFLVTFQVEKILPLIGSDEEKLDLIE